MFLPGGQHRSAGLPAALGQEQVQGRHLGGGPLRRLAPCHPPGVSAITSQGDRDTEVSSPFFLFLLLRLLTAECVSRKGAAGNWLCISWFFVYGGCY